MMKNTFLSPLALGALVLALLLTLSPLTAARAADVEQARQFVDGIGQEALMVLNAPNGTPQTRQEALKALFARHVDIPWVGKFVLGRFWRQTTPEQRTQYLRAYEDFVLTHYTSHFADYKGGAYVLTDARAEEEGQYIVSMRLEPAGRAPIMVDYRIHTMEDGSFKVYDIVVEGVSLITTQRSEFASVVQKQGIDSLIQQLAAKALTPAANG